VFATMPFAFEGRRRHEQAQTALNELSVLSNALVTFDNNRMGELVLAKQGIHEAFASADRMISESIKAVIRLVVRPGLINIGLDDLMSALRATRSRCLFGSGIAAGPDRASRALRNALASPLLDQGALLKDAQTVLVHLCGGESLTLFEIELLMQGLQKFVPEKAHVLFGAAVDPSMGGNVSVTLISALPEDRLAASGQDTLAQTAAAASTLLEPSDSFLPEPVVEETAPSAEVESATEETPQPEPPVAEEAEPAPVPSEEPTPVKATFVWLPPSKEPENAEPVAELETEPLDPVEPDWMAREEDAADEVSESHPGEEVAEPVGVAVADVPPLALRAKKPGDQGELSLDGGPRGRFEGESPNVFEGEDLDVPPFLRKKH
jgi:cell division protein FtsZ